MTIHSGRPKGQLETALGMARMGAMLIGATSVGVAVTKLAVPLYRYMVFTAFPAAWAGFLSFLAPQYLFVVVNLIILVIWKLSEKKAPDNSQHYRAEAASSTGAAAGSVPLKSKMGDADVVLRSPRPVTAQEDMIVIPSWPRKQPYSHVDGTTSFRKPAYVDAQQVPTSPGKQRRDDSAGALRNEQQSPSAETNSDDSCVTAEDDSGGYDSPEPVASPVRHRRVGAVATPSRSAPVSPYYPSGGDGGGEPESLEDAWRVITGTGGVTARLRKNETWRVPPRVVEMQPARRDMRKSETFNDGAARRRAGGIRAEAPVSWERDELNQKFDAFIKKMNEQLRLQRQESERQRLGDRLRRGY